VLVADGFDVIGEAIDGTSGLEAVRSLRPDLVLLDIGLPDVDGFVVAERLAASADAPSVVLISSRDLETYRDRVRTSPVAGFIAKDRLDGATLRSLLGPALP
jgi:DNA-binding NarL/FixJ family response regulator